MPSPRTITQIVLAGTIGAVTAMFACSSSDDGGKLRRGLEYTPAGSSTGDTPLEGDQGDSLAPSNPPTSVNPDGGGPEAFDAGQNAVPTEITATDLRVNCKLINGDDEDHDGPSGVQASANLKKADFGIPVAVNDHLFFLFGDSAGVKNIWQWGKESLPNAVGYSNVGFGAVVDDPKALCPNLRILKANATDFAGAAMIAPDGQELSDYIRFPAGPIKENEFPQIPGNSEIPTGAFERNGNIYIFHTTVDGISSKPKMRESYLARWSAPTPNSKPAYQILYRVDGWYIGANLLRGNFIRIAPVAYDNHEGDYVYLFGTGVGNNGELRQSQVYLARKRVADIETKGGFTRYDPDTKDWVAANKETRGIIDTESVGELSVRYYDKIQKFVMLTQEYTFLHARFADKPEGPWSAPVEIANMKEGGAFHSRYCCSGSTCPGDKIFYCQDSGLFAPYLLPKMQPPSGNSFSLSFTISSWLPYNVAWMTATFSR